jgi:SAM-dependent methyltransferase
MRPNEIRALYDRSYAEGYDQRFLFDGAAKHQADFELKLLRRLLISRTGLRKRKRRWLDVACGTGYFMSKFAGIRRAGLDLSPEMLNVARLQNPDALFFREGDFRDPFPDWKDSWDVVSCMWFSYCYVDTVAEVEQVIGNLAAWTAPTGVCFVPVCDLPDLARGADIPYLDPDVGEFGGSLWITGFVWTWEDALSGRIHKDLVSPHLDHMVTMFSRHFEDVEVVRYPPRERGRPSWQKAIVARGKKSE